VVFAGHRTDLALVYRALVEIVTNGETGRGWCARIPRSLLDAALVGALADLARLLAWGARAREEVLQRFRFDRQVEAIHARSKEAQAALGAP